MLIVISDRRLIKREIRIRGFLSGKFWDSSFGLVRALYIVPRLFQIRKITACIGHYCFFREVDLYTLKVTLIIIII